MRLGAVRLGVCRSREQKIKNQPDFHFVVMGFLRPFARRFAKILPPRRAPERSTPSLSRPCESDAGFRVCRPRRCLLCARQFLVGSARFDTPTLLRPKQDARAPLWLRKSKNDVNARYGNYQMRMTSSDEIIKYKSLTSSVGRKQHNVA